MTDYEELYARLLGYAIKAAEEIKRKNYGIAADLLENGINGSTESGSSDKAMSHSISAYIKRHKEIK